MLRRVLIAMGLAVAALPAPLLTAAGQGPGSQLTIVAVSAKLAARGAAVNVTVTYTCNWLDYFVGQYTSDGAETGGGDGDWNPGGMIMANISESVGAHLVAQGGGQNNFNPTQFDGLGAPWCDGNGYDSTNAPNTDGGSPGPGDLRVAQMTVNAFNNIAFKKGTALVYVNGMNCVDLQGGFGGNNGPSCFSDANSDSDDQPIDDSPGEFGGGQVTIKIT